MLIVIMASAEQKAELLAKSKKEELLIEYINEYHELQGFSHADAFFLLSEELNIQQIRLVTKPVFIHSVTATLVELKMPANVSRINAWPTFLQRDLWEVVTIDEAMVKSIFEQAGWKYVAVPDEPGLIAARIIAMIINEAYFALQEDISTKNEIDIAMKLGTNYPFGPFEWAQKIGLMHVYNLLKALEINSAIYKVSPALEAELVNT